MTSLTPIGSVRAQASPGWTWEVAIVATAGLVFHASAEEFTTTPGQRALFVLAGVGFVVAVLFGLGKAAQVIA